MDRTFLIEELQNHTPTEQEAAFLPLFLDLLRSQRCFYRDHLMPGHITGSAILIDPSGNKILMNHHKTLDKWLNFGGHCDGEEDVLSVAIRETMEESGLTAFKPLTADIIDIDIHPIPANPNKGEPEHEHFDIRYAMRMTSEQIPVISEESLRLEWMDFETAFSVTDNDSGFHRLLTKVQNLI